MISEVLMIVNILFTIGIFSTIYLSYKFINQILTFLSIQNDYLLHKNKINNIIKWGVILFIHSFFLYLYLSLDFNLTIDDYTFPDYIFVIIAFVLLIFANFPFKKKFMKNISLDVNSIVNGIFLVNTFLFSLELKYRKFYGDIVVKVNTIFTIWILSFFILLILLNYKNLIFLIKNRKKKFG